MSGMQNNQNPLTQKRLETQIRALGVGSGDLLMVHASMRAIGPIVGRGKALISALLKAVGEDGTITAYADYEPTPELPYFDPARSRARSEYGVFPEILRTYPNVCRSLNPGGSMVAVGARAKWLCENHPLKYGYGPGSPLAKICECNGKVLLLGSHFDHVTILHFAEHRARLPNKRVVKQTETVLENGKLSEVAIEEFNTSEPVCVGMPQGYFELIIRAFIETGHASQGTVGGAASFLLPARELVDFAVQKMEVEYGAQPGSS